MSRPIIHDGTSQDDRLLPALKAGYVRVDEMRLEDLLSMSMEYAGFLEYRDFANRPGGHWRAFFESDEACVLAALISVDLNRIEAEFMRALADKAYMAGLQRVDGADAAALPALALAQKLDEWFDMLGRMSSVAAVRAREKLSDVIENTLADELQQLRLFLREQGIETFEPAFAKFGVVWQPENVAAKVRHDTRQFLKSNFYAFNNAVRFLQDSAPDLLALSLGRGNHDPAMGLLITFLRLFGKAQAQIGDFTQRHLDFYYDEVLKIRRREGTSDSVHLIFAPNSNGREVVLGKGTEFKAGLDANKTELIYTADNELKVTDAKVGALYTLYLGRNTLSSPENALPAGQWDGGAPRHFATSLRLGRIMAGGAMPAPEGLKAYPLFGAARHSRADDHLFEDARTGFAVASNVLLLKQGRRDVTLTFKIDADGGRDKLADFVRELAGILETTEQDAFFKAFRNMFKISLTGEAGWMAVDEYLPLSHVVDKEGCEENSFKIRFRLPDSAGSVGPYSQAVHGERFDTGLPVARFCLNPDGYLYPYSLLSRLVISEVAIDVEVRGCTDVLIYSQLGQLSDSAQFNPFGPAPVLGDYFIVGNYEAARKKLLDFEVDVEWGGVPQEMGGFEEYYREYPELFGNAMFKVRLSVLRDRKWIPATEDEQPETALFDTGTAQDNGESRRVSKRRRISFRGLCKLGKPIENAFENQYGYDTVTKDGFFRMTLLGPPFAFGHKDYPLALSRVMTENARRSRFGIFKFFKTALPQKPLPNSPYTPLINSISVNYKASARISLANIASADEDRLTEKIYHLHPLGLMALSPKAYGNIHMVPRYEEDGTLFIGLAATKLAGLLTLFFHLREDSLPEAGQRTFKANWYYLASNQWKRLEKSEVISDTTNGFLTSGIVTLDIPADINRENTLLPEDKFWLRVSMNDENMHALCSIYGVYAQALKASWRWEERGSRAHLAQKLAAGTIREARSTIPGIGEIRQIMDSFGGGPPESVTQRTLRVSERLRHKNRAVTPWDYERLILQRFPEIYKVKCFSCMSGEAGARVEPGHLLVVLIPYLKEAASANMRPMVNALLLREVREFVEGHCSAFVRVHVRNPAYEQIQVRCKIRLRPGASRGLRHNELNQAVVDYLSPWSRAGLKPRFGWQVRCNDIQAHLQGLDYVESVSGLSLLHITEDDGHRHRLTDTARTNPDGRLLKEVGPAHPWSIAIPARQHLIEIVDNKRAWQPAQTGVGKLSIGSTFILSRGNQ